MQVITNAERDRMTAMIAAAARSDAEEAHEQESALRRKDGLRLPQIRVLRVLYNAKGPLSRTKINDKVGNKTVVVTGRAVGYSDPEKRAAFEQTKDGGGSPGHPCPSLLTLGYVREKTLDIDGLEEVVVEITAKGRKAYEALGHIKLPPLRD